MLIKKMVFMASAGLGGLNIQNILAEWEAAGFFSYILPFLIIFAFVFGILERIKMFGDSSRGVNAVIALAVGFLSLQFNFVPMFFAELFPRFGIGLSVILILLIASGLFIESKETWIMFALGMTVFGFVILKSFGAVGWASVSDIFTNLPSILLIVLVIVIVVLLTKKERTDKNYDSVFAKTIVKAGNK